MIDQIFKHVSMDDLQNITFEFLNLDEFNLTDELYVKMNARGKPLTNYENFKAKFESYIHDNTIKAKFDNEWFDVFYQLAQDITDVVEDVPKLADDMFYNFFYNISFNYYVEINTFDTEFLSEKTLFDFYQNVYPDKVKEVLVVLTKIDRNNTLFKKFLGIEKKSFDQKRVSYWDRARFFTCCLGLINDYNDVEMRRWIRVTTNLINNALIQGPDDFKNAIRSLRKMCMNSSNDIYGYLDKHSDQIDYFDKIQKEEESLKAKLIIDNGELKWEDEFILAEQDWYLDGQIQFLLDFSERRFDDFTRYRDKFLALFSFAKESKPNQILVYRALLSKGDYLPKGDGSNKTFCSFEAALRTKRDNWRRVFNDASKKRILKELLDDGDFDINQVQLSLRKVIENYSYTDWKSHFIKHEEYISYCEKLQIRWYSEHEIYLLKRSQMNGAHVELHTWDLYNKLFGLKPNEEREEWWRIESNKVFDPFSLTWYFESTSWEVPTIVLDEWKYKNIIYKIDLGYEENGFYLKLYNSDEIDAPIEQDIIDVLKKNGFDSDNIKRNLTHTNIIRGIETVCNSLKQLI